MKKDISTLLKSQEQLQETCNKISRHLKKAEKAVSIEQYKVRT